MPDGPVVALIFLVVGGVLVALYFYVEHRRHRHDDRARGREVKSIPLFRTDMLSTRGEDGALHAGDDAGRPPVARRTPAAPRPAPDGAIGPAPRPTPAGGITGGPAFRATPERANGNGYAPAEPPRPGTSPFSPPPRAPGFAPVGPTAATAVAAGRSDASLMSGETLRFAVPDEGTLRFLPGRLEVAAGPDAGREVRFVAPPGGDPNVEVTFGRTEGPAYRHVQLLARTVSRRHACMQLVDDHWSLQNLSATNPVILNGRPLAADEVAPLLVDGDRIEMGEVVFVFHSR